MKSFDWKLLVDFLTGISWPVVVGLIVFVLRRPLLEILSQLARRASKVSLYKVSVELSTLPELSANWSVGSVDPRQLTSAQIFDSASQTLIKDLLRVERAEYAIVDLRKGKSWLTSRLFVFSLILGEVRGIRAFVFLESVAGVRKRFIGIASPASVRRGLGTRYPWLEEAWARAMVQQFGVAPVDQEGVSMFSGQGSPLFGMEDQWRVTELIRAFVAGLQRSTTPPENENHFYLTIESQPNKIWERASWIDADRLERDLAGLMETQWCEDSPDRPRSLLADAIVRRNGQFVALVDEDRRFKGLVDRYTLLAQLQREQDKTGKVLASEV